MDHATPIVYRTIDPLENMTIRVHIRKVPRGEGSFEVATSASSTSVSGFEDDEVEQVVDVSWQMKLFGPR